MYGTTNNVKDNIKHKEKQYWNSLYKEYLLSYRIIKKIANKIRRKYAHTTDKDKIKERRIVYDIEKEMLEKVIDIERYLPYKKRYYTNKKYNEYLKLLNNKASNTGLILIDNRNKYNTEKVVYDKLFKRALLDLLKNLLTKKQYQCLYMYFYKDMIQEEIADKLNIEQQTVSEHIQKALERIYISEELSGLIEYLF